MAANAHSLSATPQRAHVKGTHTASVGLNFYPPACVGMRVLDGLGLGGYPITPLALQPLTNPRRSTAPSHPV